MENKRLSIAIIPDGNRRFMEKHGILNLKKSYQSGIEKFHEFVEWCKELGAKDVTVYALSLENIENRTNEEISILLDLFLKELVKKKKKLMEDGVEVRFCGDMEKIKELNYGLFAEMSNLEIATKNNHDFKLNIALAYGGRQEILQAIEKFRKHGFEITETVMKEFLWVKSYPDIIIRTTEQRLSNFLLWQSAYSELYFIPKFWQEFEKEDLEKIIEEYKKTERRFGG